MLAGFATRLLEQSKHIGHWTDLCTSVAYPSSHPGLRVVGFLFNVSMYLGDVAARRLASGGQGGHELPMCNADPQILIHPWDPWILGLGWIYPLLSLSAHAC